MTQTNNYSATVAKRLDEFLAHPSKRVLLFKGEWGVGKTHYWTKTYLPDRLQKPGGIRERLYAYVSLFGVESADDLEQRILVNSVKTGDKDALNFIETGVRKAASFARLIPGLKDYEGLIHRVGQIATRNTLVCIDEIERKAEGLSLEVVMGLISVLREHNCCRFILIMNDEQLGNDTTIFNKYREKIIDETITFSPAIEDNVRLMFGNDPSLPIYIETFKRLGVSNLRVMQQASWAIEHFSSRMLTLEPAIAQQFQEHIVLLSAFFHIPSLGIDVSKLPHDSLMDYLFNREEDKSPEHKREVAMARQYKYEIFEYDHIIVDYLKDGRCDADRLEFLLGEANANEKEGQIQAKFQEMWTPYNRSFKASTSEVLKGFTDFLDKYAPKLSFSQLWEILKLTDSLGAQSKRQMWLDSWIAPQISRSSLKGLRVLAQHCKSRTLKVEIRKRETAFKRNISIHDLIISVVDKSGWNPEIVNQLGSCNVDDFRKAFLRCDKENFLAAIHEFCKLWRQSGQEEKAVEQKVEDALLAISKSNKLNQKRVRMIIPWAFPDKTGNTPEVVFEPDITE